MKETKRRPTLRFKKQPNERGLARICQGPRGQELWYGDEHLGSAREKGGWGNRGCAFYWHISSYPEWGIERKNTCNEPVDSMNKAKAQLREYVEAALKAKGLR